MGICSSLEYYVISIMTFLDREGRDRIYRICQETFNQSVNVRQVEAKVSEILLLEEHLTDLYK